MEEAMGEHDGIEKMKNKKEQIQASHNFMGEEAENRKRRMMQAIHQGDADRLWQLITAAVETGFVNVGQKQSHH